MPNNRDLAQDITVELETDNEQLDRNGLQNIASNAATGYYSTRPRDELIRDLESAGATNLARYASAEAYTIDQADRREDYEEQQHVTAATERPPAPVDGEFEEAPEPPQTDEGTVVFDDPPQQPPQQPPPPSTPEQPAVGG